MNLFVLCEGNLIKKGFMAIKVDFEKVYDRLQWDFVHIALADIGVPKSIQVLYHEVYYSSVHKCPFKWGSFRIF